MSQLNPTLELVVHISRQSHTLPFTEKLRGGALVPLKLAMKPTPL